MLLILLISFSCLTVVSASDLDSTNLDDSFEANTVNSINVDNTQEAMALDDNLEKSSDYKILSDDESADDQTSDENTSSEDENATMDSDVAVGSTGSVSTDLQLDNDADKENVKVGELVTWILEAKNYGPYDAENTQVYDELPDGLEYVSHTATKGEFNPDTGIWKIGDLKVGEKAVLKIVTKALTPGEKINKANLTSDTDIIDPDECYEEEEIDVEEDSHFEKTIHSKQLPCVGNPVFLLILSLMAVFGLSIRRK